MRSNASPSRKSAKASSIKKARWKDDAKLNEILQSGIESKNKGDYVAAIQTFEAAIHKSPQCSMAYWLLGGVYYSFLHDAKASIRYFKKAVRLSPKTEMASLGLFHALWDTGQVQEALDELKRFQLLTDWSCQDYIEIVEEMKEKWLDSPKPKKEAKTRKRSS